MHERKKMTSRFGFFFVLMLGIATGASAAGFNLTPTMPRVTETPVAVKVGDCEVFDYRHDYARYIYVRIVAADGVIDTFRHRAWKNHNREPRSSGTRLWWNTPDPNQGPQLIATCPLYLHPGLPKEVRELGAPDPEGK